MDPDTRFAPEVDELLYRACQETLRNVRNTPRRAPSSSRSGAKAVERCWRCATTAGIAPEVAAQAREGGHMGLQILADLVDDAGGELTVAPGDGGLGTVVRVEVPTG